MIPCKRWEEGEISCGSQRSAVPGSDVEDPAPSHIRQQLRHDPDIQRPIRCRKNVRVSSLTSLSSNQDHIDCPSLPFATKCEASLLFVDVSGFTLLSTLLALEDLSKAINEYSRADSQ
jgi:class 3 adenylate cyclase